MSMPRVLMITPHVRVGEAHVKADMKKFGANWCVVSGVPRKPLNLDAHNTSFFSAAHEASLIPVEDVNKLQLLEDIGIHGPRPLRSQFCIW